MQKKVEMAKQQLLFIQNLSCFDFFVVFILQLLVNAKTEMIKDQMPVLHKVS